MDQYIYTTDLGFIFCYIAMFKYNQISTKSDILRNVLKTEIVEVQKEE